MSLDLFESLLQKEYQIFVNTPSFLNEEAEVIFYNDIAPLLHRYNQKLILPYYVYCFYYEGNDEKKWGAKIIKELMKKDLVRVENTVYFTQGNFDYKKILSAFSKIIEKYNICLINSEIEGKKDNFSSSILKLKNTNTYDVKVLSLKDKKIVEFCEKKTSPVLNPKKFSLPSNPNMNTRLINISNIPKEDDYVYDENGTRYNLEKQLGREGGEGTAYVTDRNHICKIYKKEKLTEFKKKKIELFTKHSIKVKNVCFPISMAYNNNNEFVGYLMQQANGFELQTSIFKSKKLLEKKFPNWNRLHLVNVAINILSTVQKLHEYNIILGDINPGNILIDNETNTYFIDTDSFQVEGYPCPVGMPAYTKPIHHGIDYKQYLRKKEDDIYAVSVILFQLMLPGKMPYSCTGGGKLKENMKPENFPYKYGDNGEYNNPPKGYWTYIWSHLPRKIKNLFGETFREEKRKTLEELIEQFKIYRSGLKRDYSTKKIFPLTFKQVDENNHFIEETNDNIETLECYECEAQFYMPKKGYTSHKKKGLCPVCR